MTLSPFQRLFGADFERLPAPVRELHSLERKRRGRGRADITAAAESGRMVPALVRGAAAARTRCAGDRGVSPRRQGPRNAGTGSLARAAMPAP